MANSSADPPISRADIEALDPALHPLAYAVIGALSLGHNGIAQRIWAQSWRDFPKPGREKIRDLVNARLLFPRELEMNIHGVARTFRFWSEAEKTAYLRFAVEVAALLRDRLGAEVCLGYGGALACVRDGDLIPHDDDLDLLVGLPRDRAADIPAGLALLADRLEGSGFRVSGNFISHRKLSRDGRNLDVFVGIIEDGYFASFPGPRRVIRENEMFPAVARPLLGVDLPLPARPRRYLRNVYGPNWASPDPGFGHSWDRKHFADLLPASDSAAA